MARILYVGTHGTDDPSHLYYELGKAKERLRHKTKVILGCIKQPGFY
jgi:hypothetical protein